MKTTYEIVKEIIERGNVKEIFDILSLRRKETEIGIIIIEFCKDCSTTFVSDICKRSNTQMSIKQLWCVSYETFKIKHMYDSWVEEMKNSIKDIEN